MTKPNRRNRERQRRKEEIINAAETIFFKKGFNETTMDEIANEIELTKPALYRYFKNKKELYLSVLARGIELLNELMIKKVNEKTSGMDKIKATGYAYWQFSNEYPDYSHLVLEARDIYPGCMDASNSAPSITLGNPLEIMCKAIEIGKTDGTLRSDIDTFLTAIYLIESTIAIIRASDTLSELLKSMNKTKKDFIEHSIELMGDGIESMKNIIL